MGLKIMLVQTNVGKCNVKQQHQPDANCSQKSCILFFIITLWELSPLSSEERLNHTIPAIVGITTIWVSSEVGGRWRAPAKSFPGAKPVKLHPLSVPESWGRRRGAESSAVPSVLMMVMVVPGFMAHGFFATLRGYIDVCRTGDQLRVSESNDRKYHTYLYVFS